MRDADATIRRLRELKELGVLIARRRFRNRPFVARVLSASCRSTRSRSTGRSSRDRCRDSNESASFLRTLVQTGQDTRARDASPRASNRAGSSRALQHEQCEFGQGFLFSQPIAPEALEAILSLEALLA